jgi:hypothetical protein
VVDTTDVPPARSSPAMSRATALAVSGVLGLLTLVMLLALVVKLSTDSGGNTLGDETFDANASVLASQIERDGPILFPDLLGKGKDIYVQHLGEDRKEGWRAFRATAGADRNRTCTLQWDRQARRFNDPCEAGRTYPEDGAGLEQYVVTVQGSNKLVVDLKRTAP